jgi:hypothetical protein
MATCQPLVIGREPTSAQHRICGSPLYPIVMARPCLSAAARGLSPRIYHALRSVSDAKAVGATAPLAPPML